MKKYQVILLRRNGRYVKTVGKSLSKYAAKKLQDKMEEKYDDTYHLEIKQQ